MNPKKAVRKYFPYCPFCGEKELDFHYSFRDALLCPTCGAKWHIYFRITANLSKAVLEVAAHDGQGAEFVGKKIDNSMWRRMALEANARHTRETTSPLQPLVKEKETIIKEIVMIPCQYCGGLMPQTSVFCPNCGARRKP